MSRIPNVNLMMDMTGITRGLAAGDLLKVAENPFYKA